jgi:hypothetical protein
MADAAQSRVNALEARLNCLETASHSSEDLGAVEFGEELVEIIKSYVSRAIKPLEERIKILEGRKYMGVYKPGATYSEGSSVTWDGSEYHCHKTTREAPGSGCPDWQLKVKRGRDGRDGKDGKEAGRI